MPRIGIMLESQEGLTWEKLLMLADAVESSGFDSLSCSDHLLSVTHLSRDVMALWPALTALAIHTKQIRISPLVNSITFRHPAQVAKMAACVDILSQGRLDIGIGAGWYETEHEMFGFYLPPYWERLERLEEYIDVLKALWSGEVVDFKGQYYTLKKAEMHPIPSQRTIPIIMGGMSEKILHVIAKYADEWNSAYITKEAFLEKLNFLNEKCYETGRDPSSITHSLMIPYIIGMSDREIQRQLDGNRTMFSNMPTSLSEWIEAGLLGGSPQQIVDQICERAEVGIGRFILQHNNLEDVSPIELIATKVLPYLS